MAEDFEKESFDMMRKIGQLEERTNNLDSKIRDLDQNLKTRIKELDEKVDNLHSSISKDFESVEAKLDDILAIKHKIDGSWKALAFVSGAVVVISTCLSWVVDRWSIIKNSIM